MIFFKISIFFIFQINFTHLHKVDTTQPFSFFIHTCEPQPEPPKPIIQSNEKLSQKVAEMVQKGLNASPKVVNPNTIAPDCNKNQLHTDPQMKIINTTPIQQVKMMDSSTDQLLQQQQHQQQQNQLSLLNMESVALNQVLPIQNGTDIKLQVQPQLSQLTQVVVSAPQLDMTEPLLMCQPTLMFDPTQVIPVTAHHLPHHFVQVHSHNITNQHGHYL